MPDIFEGEHDAKELRLAIVVAKFNRTITEKLLAGALDTLAEHGCDIEHLPVVWVPGSLELPIIAGQYAMSGEFDAILCLGCVIRGQTGHYDVVVQGATRALTDLSRESGVPILIGIITCENAEQAHDRSDVNRKCNLGRNAALGAIEMANLLKKL